MSGRKSTRCSEGGHALAGLPNGGDDWPIEKEDLKVKGKSEKRVFRSVAGSGGGGWGLHGGGGGGPRRGRK